jgi:hypothetical protein
MIKINNKTVLVNMWHIKTTNGLFYYAIDYIREIEQCVEILVRKNLYESTRAALPHHNIKVLTPSGIIRCFIKAKIGAQWVFTPTSHPIPFHKHQIVTLHDDFPFIGRFGRIKLFLFRIALFTSKCYVAHINFTTALAPILNKSISPDRLLYFPNKLPDKLTINGIISARAQLCTELNLQVKNKIQVALFGTDSRKKRYEDLFENVVISDSTDRITFLIYGHQTDYYAELKARFELLDIRLIESSATNLDDFLKFIDAVVSVAEHEGFGRPIALALSADIPCFLLHTPVFQEFFGRYLNLHVSIPQLVSDLLSFSFPRKMNYGFYEKSEIKNSFLSAVNRINYLVNE